MTEPGHTTAFAPVISVYTRAQAIEDGVLVDVSETAREAGFRIPVAVNRRHARRQDTYDRIFSDVPFDIRSVTIGRVLDVEPSGTWAIATSTHFIAYSDGFVADSSAWFSRKPERWFRANPRHDRVARRRLEEAVRFTSSD